MKKIIYFLFSLAFVMFYVTTVYSQKNAATQIVIEDNKITKKVALIEAPNIPKAAETSAENLDIIWHQTEPAAIGEHVYYSKETGKSFVNWALNDQRVAQYANTNTAIWEFFTAKAQTSFCEKLLTLHPAFYTVP
jgi:hypothetical protein